MVSYIPDDCAIVVRDMAALHSAPFKVIVQVVFFPQLSPPKNTIYVTRSCITLFTVIKHNNIVLCTSKILCHDVPQYGSCRAT